MKYKKIISAFFPALIFWFSCGNSNQPAETKPEEKVDVSKGIIQLTSAQIARAGITTGTFEERILGIEIPASAELIVDPEHQGTVSALSDGILIDLRVRLNQFVAKGQAVGVLRKPDLLDWQQQYLENNDKMAFLEGEYERYKTLMAADATAAKNFSKAEADLRAVRTTVQLLGVKLRQYQIDPEKLTAANLTTDYVLKAPISGTVTHIDVTLGAALTPGATVCEMVDFQKMHPVLYVFEKDLPGVNVGQQVLLRQTNGGGESFSAVVTQLERTVDPTRRAVRVHASFSGAVPKNLAAGAYLNAAILIGGKEDSLPALPKDAIIRENEGTFIFVKVAETPETVSFNKVAVRSGASDATHTAVFPLEDLRVGAEIVIKGAYYVSAAGVEADEH